MEQYLHYLYLSDKYRYKPLKIFLQASEILKHTPRETDNKNLFLPIACKGS